MAGASDGGPDRRSSFACAEAGHDRRELIAIARHPVRHRVAERVRFVARIFPHERDQIVRTNLVPIRAHMSATIRGASGPATRHADDRHGTLTAMA